MEKSWCIVILFILEAQQILVSESKFEYSSYIQQCVCQPEYKIRYPKKIEEVQSYVREAIDHGLTIKAFGLRHSLTDIICTDGIPVDMRAFQSMSFNPQDNTGTFGAGVSVRDACNFLKSRGRGLRFIPGYGNITIGGATGTAAHGSSIKFNSSLSSQVVSLVVVDGTGNLRRITSEEDLDAFRLHLGVLGIIVHVTLDTVPLYKLRAHNYLIHDDILINGVAVNMARNTDTIGMYWFPQQGKVVVSNLTIVDVNTPGSAWTNDHVPSFYPSFSLANSLYVESAQKEGNYLSLQLLQTISINTLLTDVPDFAPIYTENGRKVLNPAVGLYYLMTSPICIAKKHRGDLIGIAETLSAVPPLVNSNSLECPWTHDPNDPVGFQIMDNEISVPLIRMKEFITAVKRILKVYPLAFPTQGILLRFSKSSPIYMSSSYGRDSVHFEWLLTRRKNPYDDSVLGITANQLMMQTLANEFDGRTHWGKAGMYYVSQNMLQQRFQHIPTALSAFVSKMKEFDPHGVFANKFSKRLLGLETSLDVDPRVKHCALQDDCVCVRNSDCAIDQRCSPTKISSFSYNVCMN